MPTQSRQLSRRAIRTALQLAVCAAFIHTYVSTPLPLAAADEPNTGEPSMEMMDEYGAVEADVLASEPPAPEPPAPLNSGIPSSDATEPPEAEPAAATLQAPTVLTEQQTLAAMAANCTRESSADYCTARGFSVVETTEMVNGDHVFIPACACPHVMDPTMEFRLPLPLPPLTEAKCESFRGTLDATCATSQTT